MVYQKDIRNILREAHLDNKVLCIHSSFKSFTDKIKNGPIDLINSILLENSTLIVPTFYYDALAVTHPRRIEQNGFDYDKEFYPAKNIIFSTELNLINDNMGIFPKTLICLKDRIRGYHPSHSFSGIGYNAKSILSYQQPQDVFRHLYQLSIENGYIILIGVGLTRMTLIHLAEKLADRILFRRWALNEAGQIIEVEVGGCSEGFFKFDSLFEKIERRLVVGGSQWKIYKASDVLEIAVNEIKKNAYITHCSNPNCIKCNDMIKGGPILGN